MKRLISFIITAILLTFPAKAVEKLTDNDITISAPSAILIEKTTGEIIYEKNAHERLSPASVTKVMTMLLVAEEIQRGALSLSDIVTGSAHSSGMGGSQIWLEDGEAMSVHDMLKAVAVVSANDCAVALAEHIAGTEEAFVVRMNERARELGMLDTQFSNCTGLFEGEDHLTTAHDIALMSRELAGHEFIREYTTIWMDSLRNGEFGLSNTNKLIFYFKGATGLKTGFTTKAMYCLSATAEREGVEYVAVVMHAPTSNDRFDSAKTLLNYAFANYTLASLFPKEDLDPVPVKLGSLDSVGVVFGGQEAKLIRQSDAASIEYSVDLPKVLEAPLKEGDSIGVLTVTTTAGVIAEILLCAAESVDRLNSWQIFTGFLSSMF